VRTFLKLLPMVTLLAAAIGYGAGKAPLPYSITISTPNLIVKAGSQVRITIIVKNITDRKVPVMQSNGVDEGEFNYDLDIRDEQGKQAPETNELRSLRGEPDEHGHRHASYIVSEITYYLKPGETLQDGIIANKLYDLSKPGKYTIQVSRYKPEYGKHGFSKARVKSNKITLTVTP
jgi:hypothetical protein